MNGRGSGLRAVRLAGWALVAFVLGGCARVGLPAESRPGPASAAVAPRPGPEAASFPRTAHTARDVLIAPEHAPEDLDPILFTAASSDPDVLDDTTEWLRLWTSGQAQSFERYLERMGTYGHVVDAELDARGLPVSLRYLPIVESGYSPTARSRVGAVGLWQLMDPTARELGLTVSALVDDRRDPVASTGAALDYLESLHDEFDSWLLALAAYNGGPARVRRLIERHDPEGEMTPDRQYLSIRRDLPEETREFVPRLLAAASLGERPETFGIDAPPGAPLLFDEVQVPDATSLDVVAELVGVPEDDIRLLNPHFIRGFTPVGEPRTVRVPFGYGAGFDEAYALVPSDQRLTLIEHSVQSGETFTHIARRYGVSVSDLSASNSGLDPRRLQIGALLIVPTTHLGED